MTFLRPNKDWIGAHRVWRNTILGSHYVENPFCGGELIWTAACVSRLCPSSDLPTGEVIENFMQVHHSTGFVRPKRRNWFNRDREPFVERSNEINVSEQPNAPRPTESKKQRF